MAAKYWIRSADEPKLYHPEPVLDLASRMTLQGLGFGLLVSCVQNALQEWVSSISIRSLGVCADGLADITKVLWECSPEREELSLSSVSSMPTNTVYQVLIRSLQVPLEPPSRRQEQSPPTSER
jgi:hypothetical protein